jgi:hypothetical protein
MIILGTSLAYASIFMLFKKTNPKIRIYTSLINATLLSLYAAYIYYENNTFMININDKYLNDVITGFFLYDLTYGMIIERESFDTITGLLHHTFYIMLLRYLRYNNLSHLIYPFLPFEVPTMCMDIRKIYPTVSIDYLFGATFFVFRVVYNFYLIGTFTQISEVYSVIVTVMLAVHAFWFKTWVEKRFAIQNNRIVFLIP